MRILSLDELKTAETVLHSHLPKSLKVYGYVFAINRGKPRTLDVLVDAWPGFTTLLVRPSLNNPTIKDLRKMVFYSTDEEALRRVLTDEKAVDWSTSFMIAGCDLKHFPVLEEISTSKGFTMKGYSLVHLMTLSDFNLLYELNNSDLRLSVLDESHADTVNKTWKFGGDDIGYRIILNLINHFPTCGITDKHNQLVAWVLMYDYCAMGMLYTLPEHRGKGYAKVLVATMAKQLHSQGYPVYCFIEEYNHRSFKLFTSLGFTEVPSYRAGWYEVLKGKSHQ